MTQEEKINKLENEVRELKSFREFIIKRFKLEPTNDDLEQAVLAFTAGDPSALDSYILRGGKIVTLAKSERSEARSISGTIPGAQRHGMKEEAA